MDASSDSRAPGRAWAIILAGGEGERLSPAVCRWLGEHCPKQYCAFVGTRSMLQHTWDRCTLVTDEQRMLTVIGSGHRRYLSQFACSQVRGSIIEQPCARGTLAGLLLPLAFVMAQEPRAVVHVFPSDHFVFPEHVFSRSVRAAELLASCRPDRMVLMGARPRGPETDYGWVTTSSSFGVCSTVLCVDSFIEKPAKRVAERLFREGGFWNTMIVSARARLIWEVVRELFPEMIEKFEDLRRTVACAHLRGISSLEIRKAADRVYSSIQAADLSRHLLQKIPGRLLLLAMDKIEWSDWGRPERIEETLDRLGKKPNFANPSISSTCSPESLRR